MSQVGKYSMHKGQVAQMCTTHLEVVSGGHEVWPMAEHGSVVMREENAECVGGGQL